MNLLDIALEDHQECEALTEAILDVPELQRCARRLSYAAGEAIWSGATRPEHVYLLTGGKVRISADDAEGRRAEVETIEPGQVFGYLCFCSHRNEPVGTEARAVVASSAVRTSLEVFARAARRSSQLSSLLTQALCVRAAESHARARLLAIRSARHRLLTLLLHTLEAKARKTGSHGEDVRLHVSHMQLAEAACLTRTHVSTLMARFREEGLLRYGRGTAVEGSLTRLRAALGD